MNGYRLWLSHPVASNRYRVTGAHLRNLSLFPLSFSFSWAAAFSAKHSRDSWTTGMFSPEDDGMISHDAKQASMFRGSDPQPSNSGKKKNSLLMGGNLDQDRANMDQPSDPLFRKKRWKDRKRRGNLHIRHTLNYIKCSVATTNQEERGKHVQLIALLYPGNRDPQLLRWWCDQNRQHIQEWWWWYGHVLVCFSYPHRDPHCKTENLRQRHSCVQQ